MNDLDDALTLARLRREHPGWSIWPSGAGPVWEAITRPTPTSLHVLVGRTLPELAARLARADTPACLIQLGERVVLALDAENDMLRPGNRIATIRARLRQAGEG